MMKTNIVYITVNSDNPEINTLIDELNEIFTDITELNQDKLLIRKQIFADFKFIKFLNTDSIQQFKSTVFMVFEAK